MNLNPATRERRGKLFPVLLLPFLFCFSVPFCCAVFCPVLLRSALFSSLLFSFLLLSALSHHHHLNPYPVWVCVCPQAWVDPLIVSILYLYPYPNVIWFSTTHCYYSLLCLVMFNVAYIWSLISHQGHSCSSSYTCTSTRNATLNLLNLLNLNTDIRHNPNHNSTLHVHN